MLRQVRRLTLSIVQRQRSRPNIWCFSGAGSFPAMHLNVTLTNTTSLFGSLSQLQFSKKEGDFFYPRLWCNSLIFFYLRFRPSFFFRKCRWCQQRTRGACAPGWYKKKDESKTDSCHTTRLVPEREARGQRHIIQTETEIVHRAQPSP